MGHDRIVISIYVADKNLSIHYLTCIGTQMQVHSHLLTVCDGSVEKTWIVERGMAISKAYQPLQTWWWSWV